MSAQHTAGWDVGSVRYDDDECVYDEDDLVAVAHGSNREERRQRAALIVHAVNAHEALVAALEKCSAWMEDHGCVPPCLSEACAALALAKGGEQ